MFSTIDKTVVDPKNNKPNVNPKIHRLGGEGQYVHKNDEVSVVELDVGNREIPSRWNVFSTS
jgi:hypothetical protein